MADSTGPIFVGGEGRSGTTLLSLMLDSHPLLAVGPELHFRGPKNLGPYILDCLGHRKSNESVERWKQLKRDKTLNAGINFINRCHRFGTDAGQLSGFIEEAMMRTTSELQSFPDRCVLVKLLGQAALERCTADSWGIKIMRDLRIVDQYAAEWPLARFIHLIRDGRDVAASQMRDHATWGYDDIERAAISWKELIDRTRIFAQQYPIFELRYEDLVHDPRRAMEGVLAFLGVSWSDAVLKHSETTHTLFENPYEHPSFPEVTKPLCASNIGRFQRDLSGGELSHFERVAGEILSELGYEV